MLTLTGAIEKLAQTTENSLNKLMKSNENKTEQVASSMKSNENTLSALNQVILLLTQLLGKDQREGK